MFLDVFAKIEPGSVCLGHAIEESIVDSYTSARLGPFTSFSRGDNEDIKLGRMEENHNEDNGFMKTYKGHINDEGKTKASIKDKYEDKDKDRLRKTITKIGKVLRTKRRVVDSSMKS